MLGGGRPKVGAKNRILGGAKKSEPKIRKCPFWPKIGSGSFLNEKSIKISHFSALCKHFSPRFSIKRHYFDINMSKIDKNLRFTKKGLIFGSDFACKIEIS